MNLSDILLPNLLVICLKMHVYLSELCIVRMCASGAVNMQGFRGGFYASCINFDNSLMLHTIICT